MNSKLRTLNPEHLIYLIGFMGVGKTTFGKKLAGKLHYAFVDLDRVIETEHQCSIAEIFENKGETYFRKVEQTFLHKTFSLTNSVVSIGGGAPCFFDNMQQMNLHGETIYLKAEVGLIINRLANSKKERPLIKNKNTEELKLFITDLLAKREDYYLRANHVVSAKDVSLENVLMILQSN